MAAGLTAVQRCSRAGVEARYRPSAAMRNGQTASVSGAAGVATSGDGALGSIIGL